jgi:hypothetical protein
MSKSHPSRHSHKSHHHSGRQAPADPSDPYPPTHAAMSHGMLWTLLAAVALISVSGFGLWYCEQFRPKDQLEASSWDLRWRQIHGCSVPAMLIAFGMILRSHVFKGFRIGQNRFSGSLLLLTMAWLTVSGWGLYYCAEDRWRQFYHQSHQWFGFGLIGLLAAHWILGYRSRRIVKDSQVAGALRQTGVYDDLPS